ncbi:30S ribosomal protein S12 methylthiotransferase accessory factor YcaO [Thiopseudomonas denitrificans]|uniref:Ribosomal protein S12 methylthiotransferase accessory factor n=1 Tax=Thiopseudomonas denitrificans TaxID=1501432 RepID=A0A4V3D556_9GAMM|nr:30S ribosomal protein S12 methylthiotransferase accessory factor YcaO [Thiopseudomonas denitrificans]TDQ38487.1 ribosomal protein S12 methylthiotransferase accessory factor [Thiopseudomonas denitrificans]
MTLTYIPGKDVALEQTITRFQQQLATLGFNIEEASWLNPVPHVWSVHIRDRDCPQCFTNGKGATREAALASALGEFFERLSCNYFFADFYLGRDTASGSFVHYPDERWFALTEDDNLPAGLLDEHLLELYQQEGELHASQLLDLQSGNEERGICALPFVRQRDGQTSYIPVNIIGNLYVSNGMSAGNNSAEAHSQALAEICERHVKQRILTEAISLPPIPDNVLNEHPGVREALDRLDAAGYPVLTLDASLGGQFPVVCVVLFNRDNGTSFASFGAHPNFAVALERTVTELLQGRSLNQLDVFAEPTFDNGLVADPTNLETHFTDSSGYLGWDMLRTPADFEFCRWDFISDNPNTRQHLLELLHGLGHEVYIADYDHLGVSACRILVPGLSEIYPLDDLGHANNNTGLGWRELLCGLPDVAAEPEDFLGLLDTLNEESLADDLLIGEFLGLLFEPGSGWASLRMAELKAMLALAGGDHATALEWVQWLLNYNQNGLGRERLRHYLCLLSLLQLGQLHGFEALEHYAEALAWQYGEPVLDDALAVVLGEQRFYGLEAIDSEGFGNLPAMQRLLAAYGKLQRAKT